MAYSYDEDTGVYTVEFSEFKVLIDSLPENTVNTPYKFNITNMTNSDVTFLSSYLSKYADLSYTQIPNTVTKMNYCFQNCTLLTSAPNIPDTVTNMSGCFYGCTSLISVPNIPDTATNMSSCFQGCASLTSVPNIPNTVTDMNSCFQGCGSLTSVPNIPNIVTDMSYCFQGCGLLTSVPNIPNTVTNMLRCFYACTSLTSVPNIPNTVTNMSYCFLNCTSLTSVPNIPDTVTNMLGCFSGCTSLTSAPNIPNTVTDMSDCFRVCTSLTSVPNIPNTVTDMSYCFYACESLTSVPNIPDTVTDMTHCFQYCTSLTSVPNIPNTVTNMSYCFQNCTSLTSVPNIPDTVTNMGSCFSDCTSLVRINNWGLIDYAGTDMSYCFFGCTSLESFDSVDLTHEYYALKGLYELKKIESSYISDSVVASRHSGTNEEDYELPFEYLNEYLSLSPENTVSTPYVIKITGLTSNIVEDKELREVLVNKSTKYVDLSYTQIPDTVTYMSGCFLGCTSLTSAPNIPNTVTDISDCFFNCTSLISVPNIPDTATNMSYCFRGCESLTSVPNISDTVTNMSGCFQGCASLTSVPNIPDTVTYMGSCFYGCTSLVTIQSWDISPARIGSVDMSGCFRGCTSLENIYTEYQAEITPEETNWHLFNIENYDDTEVDVQVYNLDGTTTTEEPITISLSGDKLLTLFHKTDELVYANNGEITETDIADFLEYRVQMTKDETALNPKGNNFVLWAKDPNKVTSNILGGGGISGGLPLGTIIAYAGTNAPAGYIKADDTVYTKANYPDLWNILPSQFKDTENNTFVVDLRGKFIEGANGNLGEELEAGLPNIKAEVSCASEGLFNGRGTITTTGGFTVSDNTSYAGGDNNDGGRPKKLSFDASLGTYDTSESLMTQENSPFGKSDTVQPPATCFNYIIRAINTSGQVPSDVEINDNKTTTANVWSASKTNDEIENAVEEVDNKNNYSTTETVIGKWVDGKPIYRKITQVSIETNTSAWRSTGVEIPQNIKKTIRRELILDFSSETSNTSFMIRYNNGFVDIASINNTSVKITTNDFVVLEYTKTTD